MFKSLSDFLDTGSCFNLCSVLDQVSSDNLEFYRMLEENRSLSIDIHSNEVNEIEGVNHE